MEAMVYIHNYFGETGLEECWRLEREQEIEDCLLKAPSPSHDVVVADSIRYNFCYVLEFFLARDWQPLVDHLSTTC